MDFILYKNLDRLMPTYENKLFSFENEKNKTSKEFLFEMYDQIEKQNDYNRYKRINEEEFENMSEIPYNIMKKYLLMDIQEISNDKKIIMDEFYVGDLSNTIYGDLKVINHLATISWIVYSEDMSKIYYINMYEMCRKRNSEVLLENREVMQKEEISEGEVEEYVEKSKEELISEVQKTLSNIFKELVFSPNTIMYKGGYYILKDNENDITIYYDINDDIILGLYKGFKK